MCVCDMECSSWNISPEPDQGANVTMHVLYYGRNKCHFFFSKIRQTYISFHGEQSPLTNFDMSVSIQSIDIVLQAYRGFLLYCGGYEGK